MTRTVSYNAFKKALREGDTVHLENLAHPYLSRTTTVLSTNTSSFTVALDDPRDGRTKASRVMWPKASFTSTVRLTNAIGIELLAPTDMPMGRLDEDGKVRPTGSTILAGQPWLRISKEVVE